MVTIVIGILFVLDINSGGIIQWGTGATGSISASGNKQVTVTFPTVYTTTCWNVVGSTHGQAGMFFQGSITASSFKAGVRNVSTSSVDHSYFDWISIGY